MSQVETALWRDIMGYLREHHSSICRQWFEQLQPSEIDGGLLTVHTHNGVQRNYLEKSCGRQFSDAAQVVTGALVAVRFINGLPQSQPDAAATKPAARSSVTAKWISLEESAAGHVSQQASREGDLTFDQIVISPDYCFDNFVTGPENALAHSAAVAVANQPGTTYNPLFIHGGVGLGKTHLLQAICQSVLESDPKTHICYLSCDSFVNQFIDCVQHGQMTQFRHRYRHVDLLVIDDIHFLANRERTQEEFFHTFNELYQLNRQIVLSSDSPPRDIPQLEDRLISRFQWGLVAPVAKPVFETRIAIVRAKAALRGLKLPDDVVSYIATRIDSNARELEGAITTLQGHTALRNCPIDLALAQEVMGEHTGGNQSTQISLQQVINAVTGYYNVRLNDLQSKRRHKSITWPRQVCMWLARRHTRFSLEEIGGYFGGRDHTTVMYAIRTVEQHLKEVPDFSKQIEQLEQRILDTKDTAQPK